MMYRYSRPLVVCYQNSWDPGGAENICILGTCLRLPRGCRVRYVQHATFLPPVESPHTFHTPGYPAIGQLFALLGEAEEPLREERPTILQGPVILPLQLVRPRAAPQLFVLHDKIFGALRPVALCNEHRDLVGRLKGCFRLPHVSAYFEVLKGFSPPAFWQLCCFGRYRRPS